MYEIIMIMIMMMTLTQSSSRRILITGGTGVLGHSLVKTLASSTSLSISSPLSIYVGYRDIKKLQTLYKNDNPIQYNSNHNNVIALYPTYINLDDDNIDLSFLHNNDDDDDNDSELILINNAAVFIDGNDHGNVIIVVIIIMIVIIIIRRNEEKLEI